jgi:hypothetical protein
LPPIHKPFFFDAAILSRIRSPVTLALELEGLKQSVVVSHVFSLLQAVAGQELAPTEKDGATYKGRVYHQKPAHWHQLNAELSQGRSPPLTR